VRTTVLVAVKSRAATTRRRPCEMTALSIDLFGDDLVCRYPDLRVAARCQAERLLGMWMRTIPHGLVCPDSGVVRQDGDCSLTLVVAAGCWPQIGLTCDNVVLLRVVNLAEGDLVTRPSMRSCGSCIWGLRGGAVFRGHCDVHSFNRCTRYPVSTGWRRSR